MLLVPSVVQIVASTAPKVKSVIVGPSTTSDPIIIMVPSLLKKVSNFISSSPSPMFLRHLSMLNINHDTHVPSYFTDNQILVHLAFILSPQLGG